MKRAMLANSGSMMRTLIALLVAFAVGVDMGFAKLADGSEAGVRQTLEAIEGGVAVRVTIDVDRTELTVADRVVLTITIDAPLEVTVLLPKLDDFAGFTHVSTTEGARASVAASEGSRVWRVLLEPFLAGEKTIPPLEITAQVPTPLNASSGKKGKPTSVKLKSQPIPIIVRPIAPKDANASTPLKSASMVLPGAVPEQATQKFILALAAGTGIVSAIAGGVMMSRRRSGRVESPLAAATRELDLIATRAGAEGLPSAVAADIGRVLRAYCVDGLELAAPGATSAELASALRAASSIPDATSAEGAALLRRLDVLAFAPAGSRGPDDPTSAEFIQRARAWILSCPAADHSGRGAA